MDFENFFADMGERPSKFHMLDRIDNDGNYEPGNVRWATRTQQNRNRAGNRMLEFMGETKCLTEWSEITGIKEYTLRSRIARGWSIERMLTEVPTLIPRTKNHPAMRLNLEDQPLFHTARQTL